MKHQQISRVHGQLPPAMYGQLLITPVTVLNLILLGEPPLLTPIPSFLDYHQSSRGLKTLLGDRDAST